MKIKNYRKFKYLHFLLLIIIPAIGVSFFIFLLGGFAQDKDKLGVFLGMIQPKSSILSIKNAPIKLLKSASVVSAIPALPSSSSSSSSKSDSSSASSAKSILKSSFLKNHPSKYIKKLNEIPAALLPISCKNIDLFDCTVAYLQYLNYLPFVSLPSGGYKFNFSVSKILLKTVDSYPMNYQNPFVLGAITKFLSNDGKLTNGQYAGPEINYRLLYELEKSAIRKKLNKSSWDWVLVKQSPNDETAELFENGVKKFVTPVNTGVLNTTQDGTWFVFLRLQKTLMAGKFPVPISKKKYKILKKDKLAKVAFLKGHSVEFKSYFDPDIQFVDYFHRSEALHYYPRKEYGFPQSAGCVEMPRENAKILYDDINYGTMVTLIGSTLLKPNSNKKNGNGNVNMVKIKKIKTTPAISKNPKGDNYDLPKN